MVTSCRDTFNRGIKSMILKFISVRIGYRDHVLKIINIHTKDPISITPVPILNMSKNDWEIISFQDKKNNSIFLNVNPIIKGLKCFCWVIRGLNLTWTLSRNISSQPYFIFHILYTLPSSISHLLIQPSPSLRSYHPTSPSINPMLCSVIPPPPPLPFQSC